MQRMYIVHDQEPPPSHAKFLIHLKVFLTPSKDCQFRRNFVCPNSELLNFSAGAAHNHRMAGSRGLLQRRRWTRRFPDGISRRLSTILRLGQTSLLSHPK